MSGPALRLLPSLICADMLHLAVSVEHTVRAGLGRLHLDVMDNHLVPGFGFSPEAVRAIKDAAPAVEVDIHLMASPARAATQRFLDAGADRIIVHAEAGDAEQALDDVAGAGCAAAVALQPSTVLADVECLLRRVDSVLVFTVRPGRRGQSVQAGAMERVETVRRLIGSRELQVDGGVYAESIGRLAAAGADAFVVGSALYGADGLASADTIAAHATALVGAAAGGVTCRRTRTELP